jgi:hypothetical protein
MKTLPKSTRWLLLAPVAALGVTVTLGLSAGSSSAQVAPANETVDLLYLYGSIPPGIHDMRLEDTGDRGMSQFAEALRDVNVNPVGVHDVEIELTDESLEDYDVVLLGSNNRRFSESEAQALAQFVEQGGGVIAWSDAGFGWQEGGLSSPAGRESDNDLTEQFGMRFMLDNGAGVFTIREYLKPHFLNDNDPNEGVVYRGEGVSLIEVREPAEKLADLQLGGTSGELRLNPADGELGPEHAVLAVAYVGDGRVVGTFDRNTFWNAGEGTRLSELDHREFAQRLALWAAGYGD